MKHFTLSDIQQMDRKFRMNFVQSLPGFKTANLIGTKDLKGQENLAIFSSVMHIGSEPPLLAIKMRPVHVARHTWENIQETGFFTLNYIQPSMLPNAHQTSANFEKPISEFDACGLTPRYSSDFFAPYVAESTVQIGLKLAETHTITANGVILLIGEVQEVWMEETGLAEDGHLDMEKLNALAISGPDRYHTTQFFKELPYGKLM